MISYKQALMRKQAGIPVYPLPGPPEHDPNIPAPPVFRPPKRYTGLEGYTGNDYGYFDKYNAAKAEYDKAYADWDAKYGEAYRAPYTPPAPEGISLPSLPKPKLPNVTLPNPRQIASRVGRGIMQRGRNALWNWLRGGIRW